MNCVCKISIFIIYKIRFTPFVKHKCMRKYKSSIATTTRNATKLLTYTTRKSTFFSSRKFDASEYIAKTTNYPSTFMFSDWDKFLAMYGYQL